MSKATGSLCQSLHKMDVSIRANSVFSQYILKLAATSSNILDCVTYVTIRQ